MRNLGKISPKRWMMYPPAQVERMNLRRRKRNLRRRKLLLRNLPLRRKKKLKPNLNRNPRLKRCVLLFYFILFSVVSSKLIFI
jgi:hypothetical protein